METTFTFQYSSNLHSNILPDNHPMNLNKNPPAAGSCLHCQNGASTAATQPVSASASMNGGKVAFQNQNYEINISDQGEVIIDNKNTGEHYRIWGDPHVDVDGKRAFDFKGDTTFVLDDGTKVTIETTPWRGNNGQTISSKVSIIDGNSDFGVKITGVDDNATGDLSFETTENLGSFLDAMVDDGNYVHENVDGSGFIAVGPDGWAEVDQSVMDFQENYLRKLANGEATNYEATSLSDLKQFFKNTEDDSTASSTLNDLNQFIDNFSSTESSDLISSLVENFIEVLASFSSLAQQQSKPMGYITGLDQIISRGEFDHHNNLPTFSFELTFSRNQH